MSDDTEIQCRGCKKKLILSPLPDERDSFFVVPQEAVGWNVERFESEYTYGSIGEYGTCSDACRASLARKREVDSAWTKWRAQEDSPPKVDIDPEKVTIAEAERLRQEARRQHKIETRLLGLADMEARFGASWRDDVSTYTPKESLQPYDPNFTEKSREQQMIDSITALAGAYIKGYGVGMASREKEGK